MKKVICIYGPTAVGKSKIAVELAKLIGGEIISADSMQIYRGLDVGSAKVTEEEMQGITHYLIDIKFPEENYSVAEFIYDAKNAIEKIISNGKTPIIVGGTGLYFKGLIEGYNFGFTSKNVDFRSDIEKMSTDEIYQKLLEKNPSQVIDKNNRHRLIRALEIATFGTTASKEKKNDYDYKLFAIVDDRQKIYYRINQRVDQMINDGILDEAKYLMSLNLGKENLCMKAIGYKELIPYLKNEQSLEECKNILKQKTRNYAKRQFTFLNQFEKIKLVKFVGVKQTAQEIEKLLLEDNNG